MRLDLIDEFHLDLHPYVAGTIQPSSSGRSNAIVKSTEAVIASQR
jgi:hypothetical protein